MQFLFIMANERIIEKKLKKYLESVQKIISSNIDKIRDVIIPKICKAVNKVGPYDDFNYVKVDEDLVLDNGDVLNFYGVIDFMSINMDDDLRIENSELYCNYNGIGSFLLKECFNADYEVRYGVIAGGKAQEMIDLCVKKNKPSRYEVYGIGISFNDIMEKYRYGWFDQIKVETCFISSKYFTKFIFPDKSEVYYDI